MPKPTAKQSIMLARTMGLPGAPMIAGIEGAAQTWKKGSPLKNTAGSLVAVVETDVTLIVGIVAADASGVTGKPVLVYPALPGMIFQAELSDLTDGLYTSLVGDLWNDFGLNITGDGKWFIDADEAAVEQAVTIIGFKDPVGTNNAIAYFVFRSAVTIFA
jgi:hypothetical protein